MPSVAEEKVCTWDDMYIASFASRAAFNDGANQRQVLQTYDEIAPRLISSTFNISVLFSRACR